MNVKLKGLVAKSLREAARGAAQIVLFVSRRRPTVSDRQILKFLEKPHRRLDGKAPIECMGKPAGKLQVFRLVKQMDARHFPK